MNKTKIVIIGVAIIVSLVILSYLINPFFHTGLKLTVTPPGTVVIFDGQSDLDLSQPLNLKPGEYKVILFKEGYKHLEEMIKVKNYGVTEISLGLVEKSKPLLGDLPYSYVTESANFYISGSYNDYLEATYVVSYMNEASLNSAKTWLASSGVDLKKTEISYNLDGG